MLTAEKIKQWGMENGFSRVRILHPDTMPGKEKYQAMIRKRGLWEEEKWFSSDEAFICMASLPFNIKTESASNSSYGTIGRFARRNYYKEFVRRMKKVFLNIRIETGINKKDGRIFCNSPIPEKPLAAVCGLGFIGKNSLLITPEAGSWCVIGGLIFKAPAVWNAGIADAPLDKGMEPGGLCGECSACVQACPTNALVSSGRMEKESCMQFFLQEHIKLDDKTSSLLENRIYGCDICQEVCPKNNIPEAVYNTKAPEIPGEKVLIADLLQLPLSDVRNFFKGTPMGMGWLQHRVFIRNALIAAGNLGNVSLLPLIKPYAESEDEVLRSAAEYTLTMLKEK